MRVCNMGRFAVVVADCMQCTMSGMQVVWLEEIVKAAGAGQLRRGPLSFADRVFANEINSAILETRQARPVSAWNAVVTRRRCTVAVHARTGNSAYVSRFSSRALYK